MSFILSPFSLLFIARFTDSTFIDLAFFPSLSFSSGVKEIGEKWKELADRVGRNRRDVRIWWLNNDGSGVTKQKQSSGKGEFSLFFSFVCPSCRLSARFSHETHITNFFLLFSTSLLHTLTSDVWSKDEDEELFKSVEKLKKQHGSSFSWRLVTLDLKGTRNANACLKRW